MKAIFLFYIIIVLYFFVPVKAFASTIILQSDTMQINNSEEEYTVNVALSLNVLNNTEYYLRGVFYKPNTYDYCGYTWNGNTWFNGPYTEEGVKSLQKITINNASWSGTLKAKIEPNDNNCSDSGTYNFKIFRYTTGGGKGNDNQEPLTVNFTAPPTPTNTPTNTPTPSNTPIPPTPTRIPTPTKTPTPTPSPKTSTPTKTPTPTKSGPTSKPTSTPSPKPSLAPAKITKKPESTTILGISTNSAVTSLSGTAVKPSPQKTKPKGLVQSSTATNLPFIIVSIAGSLFLIACAILIFLKIRKNRNTDNTA